MKQFLKTEHKDRIKNPDTKLHECHEAKFIKNKNT